MSATRAYDVVIVGGFGHVGLPLGIVLADAGLQVGLYDIDAQKRKLVEAGVLPFIEHDAEPMFQRVLGKTLHICDELAEVARADIILITLGTPVDEYLNPRLRAILDLAEELVPHLHRDHCIILRSTVYPGTTQSLYEFFTRRGVEVHLAYCPERIVQGQAVRELPKLPQVIAGFTPVAVQRAGGLFRRLGVETIEVTVQEAELVKLFANAWRYIEFAIANQFYMIARGYGADYHRLYHAMTHNYDRAKTFPRPGFAAGPCLLKDTLQLTAFYGNNFQLGHAAMMVNEGLPNFLVEGLRKSVEGGISNRHVGILGMAFKADIDDSRDSLSFKLAKILRFHGAIVSCSDEFIVDPSFVSCDEVLATCPIVIIGVPHSSYRNLRLPEETHLVDLWGVVEARMPDMGAPAGGQFPPTGAPQ